MQKLSQQVVLNLPQFTDDLDVERISFIKSLSSISNGDMHVHLAINVNFDQRFMAKLALGIAYCLFGRKVLETEYGKELRKGLWYREAECAGDGDFMPQIIGSSAWSMKDDEKFSDIIGDEHAVSLIILPIKEGVGMTLSVGKKTSGTIMCASLENLTEGDLKGLRKGKVILLYKYLQESVSLSLPDYLAHKIGNFQHPRLKQIEDRIRRNKDYFKNL